MGDMSVQPEDTYGVPDLDGIPVDDAAEPADAGPGEHGIVDPEGE